MEAAEVGLPCSDPIIAGATGKEHPKRFPTLDSCAQRRKYPATHRGKKMPFHTAEPCVGGKKQRTFCIFFDFGPLELKVLFDLVVLVNIQDFSSVCLTNFQNHLEI